MTKNYERKKCRTEVQQQSTTDSPQTLRVSIPLESFTAARVTSVFELSSRLKVASELPGNWMNMTNSSAEASNICLCYLTQRPPLHYSEVQYTIQIHHHSNNVLFVFFTKAQSFIELVPYLFSLSGVKSFLSQIETLLLDFFTVLTFAIGSS